MNLFKKTKPMEIKIDNQDLFSLVSECEKAHDDWYKKITKTRWSGLLTQIPITIGLIFLNNYLAALFSLALFIYMAMDIHFSKRDRNIDRETLDIIKKVALMAKLSEQILTDKRLGIENPMSEKKVERKLVN